MIKLLVVAAIILLLTSCARSRGNVRQGQDVVPSHAEPVCLLKSPMPSSVAHRVLGDVVGSKHWYGSTNEIIPLMAAEARKMGADAIVNFNVGHRIGMWAWARPVGSGVAVKVEDRSRFNCAALGGEVR